MQQAETPFVLDVHLDRDSTQPLYEQISKPLEDMIVSGKLTAGTLIEDEVTMATRLQVSRPTARRALQDLVNRGLLSRRRGVGTRVTPSNIHRQVGLTSLNDDLKKAGFGTKTDVLDYAIILASEEEASDLECPLGIELVRIRRLRWSNDEPLSVLTNLIPADIAPSLTELTTRGLYECLREGGIVLASARQVVGAKNATAEEAQLLDIAPADALLTLERTAYDQGGRVVEYGNHVYNAARYTLNFTSTAQ